MKFRWLLVGVLVVLVMVPALVLTAARLVQPDGGLWVRLVSFTPFAIPLYAVAFLLLLLATIRGRGGWRRTAAVLTVVALGGVVLHGWWASGPYVGDAPTAGPRSDRMVVMSANLMAGQASPARVVETAVRNGVDVLVLQEVTLAALGKMQTAGLGTAFPSSAGRPSEGTRGTMVFADRELTDVQRLDTGFGSYSMRAGDVTLFAVHPRPPVGEARAWAADQAVVRRAVAAADGTRLVVGDLNATPDHEAFQDLLDLGLRDAATQARSRWQPTWPAEQNTFGIPVPSLIAIDHVLAGAPLRAVRTDTVTIAGSDHRALVAILAR